MSKRFVDFWIMLKFFLNNISSYFETIKYVIEALTLKIESYSITTKWKIIYEGKIELIVLIFLHRLNGVFVSLYSHVACFTPLCCFFLGLARGSMSFYLSSLCLRSSILSCVALWLAFNGCLVFIFLNWMLLILFLHFITLYCSCVSPYHSYVTVFREVSW